LKVTVPVAAEGETVAVRVTLAPRVAVVIAVFGADVSPAFRVVVVAVAVSGLAVTFVTVAWALVMAASKNRSSTDVVRLSNIFEILRHEFAGSQGVRV